LVAIGVVGGSLCLPKLTPLLWLVAAGQRTAQQWLEGRITSAGADRAIARQIRG